MTEEELRQWAYDNIDGLYFLVQKGLKAILPNFSQYIGVDKTSFWGAELILLNDSIAIRPTIIDGYPNWVLHTCNHKPFACPNRDGDVLVGICRDNVEAAVLAVNTMFDLVSKQFWNLEVRNIRFEEKQEERRREKHRRRELEQQYMELGYVDIGGD